MLRNPNSSISEAYRVLRMSRARSRGSTIGSLFGSMRMIFPENQFFESPRRSQHLRAKRPAHRLRRTLPNRVGVSRLVQGISAEVPVVHVFEARPVASGDVEHSAGTEGEASDRMAEELLRPILSEDRLAPIGLSYRRASPATVKVMSHSRSSS